MSVFRREGSPFFWCRFMLKGRRYAESTGILADDDPKTMKRAVNFEVDLRAKVKSGKVKQGKAPTLEDFSKQYLLHVDRRTEAGTLKPSSREAYHDACLLLSRTRVWRMRIDKITRSVAAELTFPGSAFTANRALKTLHAMLAYAEDLGLLVAVPKIGLRRAEGRERLMTASEQEIILRCAPVVLRDLLTIMLDCGARPDEVCRIQWNDINWAENRILIQRGKTAKARRHVGMTSRMREVFDGARQRNARRGLAESPFVFASKRGKTGHVALVAHTWAGTLGRVHKELSARNTVLAPGLVPYSARHTYATNFLAAGGDAGQLMRLLGHTSLHATTRYVHLLDAAKSAEVMNRVNATRLEIVRKQA